MYLYGKVSAKLGTYVPTRIIIRVSYYLYIRGKFAMHFVLFLKFKYSENATKIVEDGRIFCDLLRISELYIEGDAQNLPLC